MTKKGTRILFSVAVGLGLAFHTAAIATTEPLGPSTAPSSFSDTQTCPFHTDPSGEQRVGLIDTHVTSRNAVPQVKKFLTTYFKKETPVQFTSIEKRTADADPLGPTQLFVVAFDAHGTIFYVEQRKGGKGKPDYLSLILETNSTGINYIYTDGKLKIRQKPNPDQAVFKTYNGDNAQFEEFRRFGDFLLEQAWKNKREGCVNKRPFTALKNE